MTDSSADPYELARRDPHYRDRVAGRYEGGHAVLDALWWHVHPLEPSPAGAPSSAAIVAELERAAFSQQGERELTSESIERLVDLSRRVDEERLAIARAIAWAEHEHEHEHEHDDRREPASVMAAADPSVSPTGADAASDATSPAPGRARPRAPRLRSAPLVAIGAVALIVGLAAGVGISRGMVGDTQQADVAAVASASLEPLPAGYRPSAFQIFDRPQAESDLPPYSLGSDVVPESVRSLGLFADAPPPPVATTSTRVFVARDSSGRVCLIFVGEGERQASTCSSDGDFARSGLRLSWRTRTVDAYATVVGAVDQTVFWRETGQVTTELRAAG